MINQKIKFFSIAKLTFITFILNLSLLSQTYVNRVYTSSGSYYNVIKEISGSETWTPAGSPYIVEADNNFDNCGVNVLPNATLTIEPGTEIRFEFGRGHASLKVWGNLNAIGTESNPIVFKSAQDYTDPSYHDWGGIQLLSGSKATLKYVKINQAGHRNAGWQVGFVDAALYIDSCSPQIENCIIENSRFDGIRINRGARPSIINCTVNNSLNFAVVWTDVTTSVPKISGLRGSGNTFQGILVPNGSIRNNMVLDKNDIPWYFSGWDDNVVVDTGVTLTIAAGAILKFNYGRSGGALVVDKATLNCQGTLSSPVIFTSYLDDSIAGDFSIKDTQKAFPGAWSGLRFINGAEGSLTHTTIRYAGHITTGWQGWHPAAAMYLIGSSVQMQNVTIEFAEGDGIKFSNSKSTLKDVEIKRCGGWAIIQEGDTLRNIPSLLSVKVSDNRVNGIGIFGVLGQDVEFKAAPLAYVINGWLTVNNGKKLSIGPGTVIKTRVQGNSYKGGLFIDGGTLTALAAKDSQVVFTSIADDNFIGNTDNNDTLLPAPSDWNGIVGRNNANIILKWCRILYAGHININWNDRGGNGITADNCSLHIENCYIEKTGQPYAGAGGNGISLLNCKGSIKIDKIDGAFNSAIRLRPPLLTVPLITVSAAENCRYNSIAINGAVKGKIELNASIPIYIDGRCTVEDSAALFLGAGSIVKFGITADPWHRDIRVAGTFKAIGKPDKPIYFTTILDDSIGGSTSNDTAAPISSSSGADYQGIVFIDSGAVGEFNHAIFKYGGFANSNWNNESGGMIFISNGSVIVRNCLFAKARPGHTHGGAAIFMIGGALDIQNSTINDCIHGIYASGKIGSAKCTNNNFEKISGFAAHNTDTAVKLDASNSWWGTEDGPSGEGPGTGCKVSKYVIFSPYAKKFIGQNVPVISSELSAKANFVPYAKISCNRTGTIELCYRLDGKETILISIYSVSGRILYYNKFKTNPAAHSKVCLGTFAPGWYVYKIEGISSSLVQPKGKLIITK